LRKEFIGDEDEKVEIDQEIENKEDENGKDGDKIEEEKIEDI